MSKTSRQTATASPLHAVLTMILAGFLWSHCALAGILYVGEPEQRSNQVIVPIQLESDAQNRVASLNFDFEYDPAILQIVGVEPGEAASAIDKEVTGNLMEPGAYRVVMMSLQPTSLHSGEVARIVFQRTDTGADGDMDVAIARTAFSSPEATTIPSQGSEAVIRVTQTGSTPVRGTAGGQDTETASEDTVSDLASFPPLDDELLDAPPNRAGKPIPRTTPNTARSNSTEDPLETGGEDLFPDAMERVAQALARAQVLDDMEGSIGRQQPQNGAKAGKHSTTTSRDDVQEDVTGKTKVSNLSSDMAMGRKAGRMGMAGSTTLPETAAASAELAPHAALGNMPDPETPARGRNITARSRWIILGVACVSALLMLAVRRRLVLHDD